ncbi:MAG: hypothetical protein QOG21_636 [Actinomycetota bacterium]|nr:hypothetical protein [Actinomycetota bacterium]
MGSAESLHLIAHRDQIACRQAPLKGLPDALKGFVGDQPLTTPAGYLQRQLFLYLIPLMFVVYAIGRSGGRSLAAFEMLRC